MKLLGSWLIQKNTLTVFTLPPLTVAVEEANQRHLVPRDIRVSTQRKHLKRITGDRVSQALQSKTECLPSIMTWRNCFNCMPMWLKTCCHVPERNQSIAQYSTFCQWISMWQEDKFPSSGGEMFNLLFYHMEVHSQDWSPARLQNMENNLEMAFPWLKKSRLNWLSSTPVPSCVPVKTSGSIWGHFCANLPG